MKKMKKYLGLLSFVSLLLCSCMDEEKFDTGAGDRLSFSEDTLRFDTVVSAESSPTKKLMVYNRNGNGVSITDVKLDGGNVKGFRVNVDGMYVNDGLSQTIDIRKEDSLYVFVELTPESFNKDVPVEIVQRLVFTLSNGVSQYVTLNAFSQDVITLKAVHTKGNVVYSSVRPYRIMDSLTVKKGDTMFVEAGTRLLFHSGAFLRVDGTLVCRGVLGKPVVFRCDRMDNIFKGQPYDRIPGEWSGIRLTRTSYGNKLNYCDIHGADNGIVCDSSDVTREKLRLENSIIHNMTSDGLCVYSSKVFVGNCRITNANQHCVHLLGGDARFVHCTIASFYRFVSDKLRGVALRYANFVGKKPYPLLMASFRNCIVTGFSKDEISGEILREMEDVDFNYRFYHCLLDTPEDDGNEWIEGCCWDNDKNLVYRENNFEKYFDDNTLLSSFQLVEASVARGAADAAVSEQCYPCDLMGVYRMSDGASDVGCYEFIKKEDENN